jgi:hypothetical protein
MIKRTTFLRHKPDIVAEALVEALVEDVSYDFNEIFVLVHEKLRERKFGGGEEMLRLRLYEKLQILVRQGIVNRTGKKYQAVAEKLKTRRKEVAAEKLAAASKTQAPILPPLESKQPVAPGAEFKRSESRKKQSRTRAAESVL